MASDTSALEHGLPLYNTKFTLRNLLLVHFWEYINRSFSKIFQCFMVLASSDRPLQDQKPLAEEGRGVVTEIRI